MLPLALGEDVYCAIAAGSGLLIRLEINDRE